MANGITAPSEEMLPPWGTPPNEGGNEWWPDWTGGFKWPGETPLGQGFQAPWTTTKPAAPAEPMEMGPNFGPYSDPGQIPPELLELYDYEAIETTLAEGGSAVFYYLVPKATEGMSEAERRRIELAEAEFMAKYGGEPTGETPMTEWQRAQMELARQQFAWEQQQAGVPGTPEGMSAYEEDYLRLQRERLAAEQGWKQQEFGLEQQGYAAQLAAQPKSWLEYAAYTGQPPVVQPWMKPLMPQQYPELAGLQAGQPVPGWPEQFTGTTGTYGGYQPSAPTGIGAQPTAGYGGTVGTTGAGWSPQTVDEYMARGLSPSEAEQAAEYDRLHAVWRAATPGPEKASAFLTKGQYAAEKPETIDRYQQAITNVQSGQPLYGQLSSSEKMQLQTLMGQYGGERPAGYAFDKYYPVSSYIDTGIPEVQRWLGAATTGESRTASYPEPATAPKREPTPTYKSIPMEESMGNVRAYIPGMSWHNIDPRGIEPNSEGTNWLGRMRQLATSQTGGEQRTTQAPTTPTQSPGSTGQAYNPAQYAAGSWAGYNPNLPLGQMPALTRPSRQYQARMGPTALDQYYAYAQGRTGITPQEMQFRLGSMAPPGGGYSGLRWMR